MEKSAKFNLVRFGLLVSAFLLLVSCGNSRKTYVLTGRIISKLSSKQLLIVNNDDIPGFMPAMTMPYEVKDPDGFAQVQPEDVIRAEVVVEKPNQFYLEHLMVTGRSGAGSSPAGAARHVLMIGEKAPDIPLLNQDGKTVRFSQFKGKPVLLTFIYTRCPFPDFCPRLSGNFAEIYKQAATNAALTNAHLLSISFDPEHDRPKVLRDYGFSVAHTHESALFNRWEFAAPKAKDLPSIADFFALTLKPEGGMITHNLSTAVIGPDGKIVKWYHGSDWQPSDLIKDATAASAKKE